MKNNNIIIEFWNITLVRVGVEWGIEVDTTDQFEA